MADKCFDFVGTCSATTPRFGKLYDGRLVVADPGWRVAPNEFLYFSPFFFTVSNTFSVVDFGTRIELAIEKARTEI